MTPAAPAVRGVVHGEVFSLRTTQQRKAGFRPRNWPDPLPCRHRFRTGCREPGPFSDHLVAR
ncbi:hypothetical protein STVIR_1840 [Streptomyces viridochromogenes Tue57]|uniref:Uncharacterized protein n=1 Tax=Streptomyces viridochromogenes Tue57 TaxID=1160705 RepID=L8PL60_STRVR|nr:hypothetical protein STVIR_1840 [Streptomyces viridochromogenes Tue57]